MIILATLVPLCFAGWLVWQSAGQPADERGSAPELMPDPSASGEPESSESGDRRATNKPENTENNDNTDKRLANKTVVIDPGHNPNNHEHIDKISQQVDIGTKHKRCDTTGTATNSGYPEAAFTLDVARHVRDYLEKRGAAVRLTQNGDRPWGPCIDERAAIGNRADADAVVSIHADGTATGNRGFHVILPAPVDVGKADTTAIVEPSQRLGKALVNAFGEATDSETSNYAGGGDGLVTRDDLGGLNLSKVPKVFIECGNMRDPREAAQLTDPKWREQAAHGIAQGIADFLTGKRH